MDSEYFELADGPAEEFETAVEPPPAVILVSIRSAAKLLELPFAAALGDRLP